MLTLNILTICVLYSGDDCISIVNASSNIKMKRIYCGPGHGIRYHQIFISQFSSKSMLIMLKFRVLMVAQRFSDTIFMKE